MSKGTLELKDYCEFSLLLALLLSGQSLLEHKKQLGEWVQSDETIDQGVIFFFFLIFDFFPHFRINQNNKLC